MNRFLGRAFFLCLFLFPALALAASSVEVKTYEELTAAIREAEKLNQPPSREGYVRAAWTVGKLIEDHLAANKLWAGYSAELYGKLSQDFQIDVRRLQEKHLFAQLFPETMPDQGLSWRHYTEVFSIKDAKIREALLEKAQREHWSSRRMEAEVGKLPKTPMPKPLPEPVVVAVLGPYAGQKVFDLGFGNFYRPEKTSLLENPKVPEFYPASVLSVVDGDTLEVLVDLGFGFTTQQKIRLRGLDAPEMETPAGYAAKKFVVEEISKVEGQVFLSAATHDKYNRWVAEVFLPSKQEGIRSSLNQKMLDSHHAKPFMASDN